MLFREIFCAYSENDMKQINTMCVENTEFLKAKAGGTYSYHIHCDSQQFNDEYET
jgi:hypothetical protein